MSNMTVRCEKCGSVYDLSFTRTIARDKDSLLCDICGETIHKWNEAKIWDSKLIKEDSKHNIDQ